MAKTDRGRFVQAALRAFRLAKDALHPSALGSFEDWSSTVRGALFRRDHPVEPIELVRASDPNVEELAMVLAFWEIALGTERMSVAEIIKTANTEKLGDFVFGYSATRCSRLPATAARSARAASENGSYQTQIGLLMAAASVAMRMSIKCRIGALN